MRPLLFACLAAILGCGGGGAQPGAGSAAPSVSGDGGPVAQPAPDAGAPAFDAGPAPDAGQAPDSGLPPDAGGSVPDAGTAADGGAAGGPGPDAGTLDADCDGLAPESVGAPSGTHAMQADRVYCTATVDGSGALALQMTNALEPQNGAVHFVGPDGTLRGSSPAGTNAFLLGRLSTFEGIAYTNLPQGGGWVPQAWDDGGHLVAQGASHPGFPSVVEDPLGGMAVLSRETTPPSVENYDERGNLRFRTPLSSQLSAVGGFAVDRLGNTFVMGDSSAFDKSVVAQWIDHDGVASKAFQLLGRQREWNHLEGNVIVRVNSGLFVHGDDWWELDSMSTQVAPPPAWFLAARPEEIYGMQMVRNGRAYGIIYGASGADCTTPVEIVTASGKSCGKASFRAGPGGCFWASAQIGYDGTFVQRVPPPDNVCSGGVCSCTWHWWSGFFR